ncbi:BTB/POZ domain-containing protein [Phanerochaete sordida]|uniref:BTB/POZ domain-containing protein n=1 Tax=Phanerochaete sordida TaxID=48140 RepID=A0A9P3G6N7_9APHY|nr:BTB/POZ domain-containing protein [Phanerochaete sordida]
MTEEVARHPKFYLPEGDCVFRIEATLFRVHRFILSRDSSAFEDMFSMPTGSVGQELPKEGYSDDRPIVLEGEVASDFEALLAVLYALPAELHELTSNPANVSQLLTVAEMANKYHFVTTTAWAISALCAVTECPTEPPRAERAPHSPLECAWASPPILRRLIEVALLCGHKQLCDHAVEKWVQLIQDGFENPVAAMGVADEHGLARLAGVAYYETLLGCDGDLAYTWAPPDENAPATTHTPALSQRVRLLRGFFALVRRWETLRGAPPPFARPEGCTYHAHGCLSTWAATWRAAARSDGLVHRPAADVLGRLRAMRELLDADRDLRLALTPACRRAAMESVHELCEREEDGLAVHFRDLTASGEA